MLWITLTKRRLGYQKSLHQTFLLDSHFVNSDKKCATDNMK
ncbi:hypothetical protein GCHA_3665 [Paraglaciecola chathamensis S18K6]|uniref:Uncharacterized protein n=1 Tax=Paraglaciecola chathamensis S18K6 TaxID=1127672 RepID=A0AAV3V567_9ALTE|nr:hypothetical protein GCHA_3665 [Paraglaciecola chathamensis S18K6]